jgi:hypothetical protein
MARSARDQLGWSEQRLAAVQEAINNTLARTAKCRGVVPKGPKKTGERGVIVSTIAPGRPLAFAADTMATPVNIRSDLQIDDLHMEDDSEVISIVKAAATVLGTIEDVEIVAGTDPAAPFAPDRVPRNALARARLNLPGIGGNTRIAAVAPGGRPTGLELVMAIESGLNALDAAGRPGDYGLLLHHRLVRILATPSAPGVPPLLEQLPPLLGSDKIAGTNALDGTFAVPLVAGILFRLEPPAVDVVHTMPPTLSVMQRTPGQTALRIEEDIVVRILDQAAVHHITY